MLTVLVFVVNVASFCWVCALFTGAPEAPSSEVRRGIGLHPSLHRVAVSTAVGGVAWSACGYAITGLPVFAGLMALTYACVATPVLWALERRARRVEALIAANTLSDSDPLFVPREWLVD